MMKLHRKNWRSHRDRPGSCFFCFIFAGILSIPFAILAQTNVLLNLEQAINYALTGNRNLLNAQRNVQRALAQVKGQESDFSLFLTPQGSAEYREESEVLQLGASASKKISWGTSVILSGAQSRQDSDTIDRTYQGKIRVEIQQPLFRDAGRLTTLEPLRLARNNVKTAMRALETSRADLVVAVVELYERILRLERKVQIDTEAFGRLNALFNVTTAREKQGRVTRVDSLRVELQRGESLSRRENSLERLLATRQDFADALGFTPERTFILEPTALLEVSLPLFDKAYEIACSNRLDYAQALQEAQDAQRGKRIARKNIWPDLNLRAGYERFSNSEDQDKAWALNKDTWFLGLSSGADIFRRRERAIFEQSQISYETALLNVEIMRYQIQREVKQALQNYRRVQTDVKIAKNNNKLASKRLRLARRLFESGRGDNFSVTDAEDAFSRAADEALTAQADASNSAYRLWHVMGILIDFPEALKAGAINSKYTVDGRNF